MSEERAKPWVGWLSYNGSNTHRGWVESCRDGDYFVPVVVTPLLPDDPRPGETWIGDDGHARVVAGAIFWDKEDGCVRVPFEDGYSDDLSDCRRPPALKTFRLKQHTPLTVYDRITVRAESREAALAKLAGALEEIK